MDSRTIGILGGGQLGRMMVEAAHRLNLRTTILDADNSPAKQINALSSHVTGSFSSSADILELSKSCDILTTEIEHVDTNILEQIEKEGKVDVQPASETIRVIQDKYLQKEFFIRNNVAVADSVKIDTPSVEALENVGEDFGYPFMLKSRTLAYDGRGNYVVKSKEGVPEALKALSNRPLYAERWAEFTMELAVLVVKTRDGRTLSYPTVETIHENNICKLVYMPARTTVDNRERAQKLAEEAIRHLPGAGIFGVEMFLLKNGTILVNEIAPRPHNSGHHTIETHSTSQFEAHIRAILDLPLPPSITAPRTSTTSSIMLNILGGPDPTSHLQVSKLALETPGATLHLYGKTESRPGRKMGHITVVADSISDCETLIAPLVAATSYTPSLSLIPASLPTPSSPIAVIMGSISDLPIMSAALKTLDTFNIPTLPRIVSAHRMTQELYEFSTTAEARGIRVIIAGAGGAAHLPGMCASMTSLPVIGVPVKGSSLEGMDSLLSIVQMPNGIPVATVGVNRADNAALLAVRILGAGEGRYRDAMTGFMKGMRDAVVKTDEMLMEVGWKKYLEDKEKEKK
ncbi:phosphoribosylaminoimidazole carboxylase ade2 [Orbilia oligospora]|uniref:Phosphoribosylaminoimidazole carboxylase n=1 Tax=Orbilia oligospora TaxID=2813651 RepID=A0A7C8JVB0_ORBOL|nr:phosphoribosylaminoimidazole carboxylase ade2 [Orbilia oligospora]KAF3167502.1 phosphoribosylaminoimidazole carboxylase ade2 [Orbilia oligospora]KAF3238999.1 phosphoribosylaminoimidazole carboxylase ade2 [Orbilia oligospora]KAF3244270.1 phosphoribosylaminoimidazole carboxylase ade2 [Orbilia oligospora]TGJ73994.1 phosphoribosylaminoimidazole carboxylase ade2 [Orbilia oligospora]